MSKPRLLSSLPSGKFGLTVSGEPYQVDGEWWEYRVSLICERDGAILDEWDSQTECYDGVHTLTREECTAALGEITQTVREGRAEEYFDWKE